MPDAVPARDRLIVALDLPSVAAAEAMVERLGSSVGFYKVGLELVYAGGLDFARDLVKSGRKVFLDLKLHDIPNTVARATERLADLGVTYLTVHAYPQTMAAAVRASAGSGTKILAVTVLTSSDDADLRAAGYAMGVGELVRHRVLKAQEAGVGGLVMSPEEVRAARAIVGDDLDIVTPGIRPAGSDAGDQKRIMTPADAIRAGADRLVVGRPITQAADPAQVAERIVTDLESALD